MRWALDRSTPTAAQVATRPLRLLAYGTLPVLQLLHADAARADNCDQLGLPQICTSSGEFFCGGDRIEGCLHAVECCPDAGCCLTRDQVGVLSASCCPSGPDYTGTCNNGQCQISASRRCAARVSRSFVRPLVGRPMGARMSSERLVREIGGFHVD